MIPLSYSASGVILMMQCYVVCGNVLHRDYKEKIQAKHYLNMLVTNNQLAWYREIHWKSC